MGLDQYLYKRIYVGANYEHRKVAGKIELKVRDEPINIDLSKVNQITESAGYWRKANQIHAWMVENIQDGADDCKEYLFDSDDRKKLYEACKQVLNHRETGEAILPTQAGFFFGSTEYDDEYYQDLQDTIEILEPTLDDFMNDYYYTSSW